MSSEDPETYLRRLAETQLRRLAAGEATAAECAARVDTVAVAFEETGALDRAVTARVAEDLRLALTARSPGPGTSRWLSQRSPLRNTKRPGYGTKSERSGSPDKARVIPAGAVLRPQDEDEDVYLLGYVRTPERAWFSVAARTSEPLVPRRHASPPSARNPRALQSTRYRPTFTGNGMTATDDTGRTYSLNFSGGGGEWYLGRLMVNPAPPPGVAWLDVHCGGESARIDLESTAPPAEVTTIPLTGEPGEAYLRRKAESLLGSPGSGTGLLTATVAGLSLTVPALRAVGLLSDDSLVPGQIAALVNCLGGPGGQIASPADLPERWRFLRKAPAVYDSEVAAASLATVLPETDGVAVHLAGMVTVPQQGTTLFGGLRTDDDSRQQNFWLRDDAGGWHTVSIRGGLNLARDYVFQASVEPPIGPETARVEFHVTGTETEVRADIPVRWWVS